MTGGFIFRSKVLFPDMQIYYFSVCVTYAPMQVLTY